MGNDSAFTAKAGDFFCHYDVEKGCVVYAIALEDSHDNGAGTQVFWYIPTENVSKYPVLGCVKDWTKMGHFCMWDPKEDRLKKKMNQLQNVIQNSSDALKSMYLNYEIVCNLYTEAMNAAKEKADEANVQGKD